MIVTVGKSGDPALVQRALVARGLWAERLDGGDRVQFSIGACSRAIDRDELLAIRGIECVSERRSSHPLVDAQPERVQIGDLVIGAGQPSIVIAGPCSVESEASIHAMAHRLSSIGVRFLRGGAFKPRTSPYAFQGHGETALRWMRRAADEAGMKVVTEAIGSEECGPVAEVADIIQIGSRNMQNASLLKRVAATRKPILLKRGMAATVEEWLSAAEYCLLHGAPWVLFCERGIRSFDPTTRNVLDLGAVALLGEVLRLPVIVDPSHAAGRRDLIPALSRAALSAGASGLMVETHEDPGSALSDGPQALSPDDLHRILIGPEPPWLRGSRRFEEPRFVT